MHASSLDCWQRHARYHEAAALSFMRQGEHDIRPALLLLFHAADGSQAERIMAHGRRYLEAHAQGGGDASSDEARRWACFDALTIIWSRRAQQPLAARSKQLRMRNTAYLSLRNLAERMYRARLREAELRFDSGTIYTRKSLALGVDPFPRSTSVPKRLRPAEVGVSAPAHQPFPIPLLRTPYGNRAAA